MSGNEPEATTAVPPESLERKVRVKYGFVSQPYMASETADFMNHLKHKVGSHLVGFEREGMPVSVKMECGDHGGVYALTATVSCRGAHMAESVGAALDAYEARMADVPARVSMRMA